MTKGQNRQAKSSTQCQRCNGKGWLFAGGDEMLKCPTCSGTYVIDRKGGVRIDVSGANAEEVASVARQLAADATERKQVAKLLSFSIGERHRGID
jgi:DnaJ-class molecular chaperone